MKKIITICMIFMLILLPVSASYASVFDNLIEIADLDMKFRFPQNNYYITRDSNADNPAFEFLGADKVSMVQFFKDNDIYFDAFDDDISYELVITATDNIITDMNQLTELELSSTIAGIKVQYAAQGMTVTETEIEKTKQAKYIEMDIEIGSEDGSVVYCQQYYTIYNSKAIVFRLTSYTGRVSDKQENLLENIIDTTEYGTDPVTSREGLEDATVSAEEAKEMVENVIGEETVENILDVAKIVFTGVIGVVIAGVVTIIIVLVVKKKNKKPAEKVSE